jgi:T4 RnlA family RNA ligase
MLLLDYLNKTFPSDGTWTELELITHFTDTFGVTVKFEKDLAIFKYDMILAKWSEPLVRDCRGTILRKGASWEICSRPWQKFFNVGEGHSGIHSDDLFRAWIASQSPYLMQKVDGTAIQLWNDKSRKRWNASTLGTITPSNVGDYNFTFSDLFWTVLNSGKVNINFLDNDVFKDCTFLFELCTTYNRILTKYPTDRIFLLSVRENKTGEYWDTEDLANVAAELGVFLPAAYTFAQLGLVDLESTAKFIEEAAKDNEKYGEYSEGFVGYVDGTPVAKFKNNTYLSLHHLSGGDTAHTKNVVIEAFFNASIDDMMKVLTDPMVAYVEALRQWYIAKSAAVMADYKAIAEGTYADQKAYALRVQQIADKGLMSFFFANKEKVVAKSLSQEDINNFFKKGWEKYEKELKALS